MPPRRLWVLLIAVAAAALVLAALVYRPAATAAFCGLAAIVSPVLGVLIHYGRKLGLNTLFR